MIYSSCFCRSVYFLCTYSNDSNNRPGHLINLSFFFYLALISFHIKFGGGGGGTEKTIKKNILYYSCSLAFVFQ